MPHSSSKNRFILFAIAAAIVLLLLYLLWTFEFAITTHLRLYMTAKPTPETMVKVFYLLLFTSLAYLIVRGLRSLLFGLIFRLKRGYEAPTLARNIFSIVVFTTLFFGIFKA